MNRRLEVAFLIAGMLAAGCGSSSSNGDPDGVAEGFMGRWEMDGTSSSFTLTCPATFTAAIMSFPIWTELDFDHGVLSDLVDVSPACASPGIGFDVDKSGVIAQAVNPDPFTQNPPLCKLVVGLDANNNPIFIDFGFSSLTLTKLAASATDKASRLLFGGNATGPLMQDDGTGTGTNMQVDTCTYMGPGDSFHRTTQP